MKKIIYFYCIIFSYTVSAQNEINVQQYFNMPTSAYNSYQVNGIYLYPDWCFGQIQFFSGDTLKRAPMKINLLNHSIDVFYDDRILILSTNDVSHIKWHNLDDFHTQKFINNISYLSEDEENKGFSEILFLGDIQLLKFTYLELQDADYNAQMSVGSKTPTLIKKEKFFAIIQEEVHSLKRSKHSLIKLFPAHEEQIKSYIKEASLLLKNEKDLIQVFEYINQLLNE